MACRFEVTLPPEKHADLPVARSALDDVDRLEARLSIFRETSEISRINRLAAAAPVRVESDLFALLEECRLLHDETEGAFDITSGPLSRCWGFLRRNGRVPERGEIEAALVTVGMQYVALDALSRAIRFTREGVEINLGSIGKGYALDRVGGSMRMMGTRAALLSGGSSSVLAIGSGSSSGGWVVGVRHPQRRDTRLARLRLWDCGMATSGGGEQYFDTGGRRYSHVMDPRTGCPVEGVAAATVIARSAAVADALATAFCVGGQKLAERYCSTHRDLVAIVTETRQPARPVITGASDCCTVELVDE